MNHLPPELLESFATYAATRIEACKATAPGSHEVSLAVIVRRLVDALSQAHPLQ